MEGLIRLPETPKTSRTWRGENSNREWGPCPGTHAGGALGWERQRPTPEMTVCGLWCTRVSPLDPFRLRFPERSVSLRKGDPVDLVGLLGASIPGLVDDRLPGGRPECRGVVREL